MFGFGEFLNHAKFILKNVYDFYSFSFLAYLLECKG